MLTLSLCSLISEMGLINQNCSLLTLLGDEWPLKLVKLAMCSVCSDRCRPWLRVPSSRALAAVCGGSVRGHEGGVCTDPSPCGLSSVCSAQSMGCSCSGTVPDSGPALGGVLGLCLPPSSFTQGPLRPGHSLPPVSLGGGRGMAPPPQIRKAWLPQEEALDAF